MEYAYATRRTQAGPHQNRAENCLETGLPNEEAGRVPEAVLPGVTEKQRLDISTLEYVIVLMSPQLAVGKLCLLIPIAEQATSCARRQ